MLLTFPALMQNVCKDWWGKTKGFQWDPDFLSSTCITYQQINSWLCMTLLKADTPIWPSQARSLDSEPRSPAHLLWKLFEGQPVTRKGLRGRVKELEQLVSESAQYKNWHVQSNTRSENMELTHISCDINLKGNLYLCQFVVLFLLYFILY